MNAHSRRRVEMGMRALEFSRAHPDSEPGTAEVVARLEQLVARANATAALQRPKLNTARTDCYRSWLSRIRPHLLRVNGHVAVDVT